MAYKLLDMAQARWRRLDGAHLLPLVRAGIRGRRAAWKEREVRMPSLRLVPGQTLRFQPNTTFRGPLSLLVEWDT